MSLIVCIAASLAAFFGFSCAAGIVLFKLKGREWLATLRSAGAYEGKGSGSLHFTYAEADHPRLVDLRERHSLETIAGAGSEEERIIGLMRWVHGLGGHATHPAIVPPYDAQGFLDNYAAKGKSMNCWMHAIVLHEAYLALGFRSRLVHLRSAAEPFRESHFVTAVYSKEAGRWLMMDPDMGGYFRDGKGQVLGLVEIREALIRGERPAANKDIGGFVRLLGMWSYYAYLSKNCFRMLCAGVNAPGQENSHEGKTYYELVPSSWLGKSPVPRKATATVIRVDDPAAFWASP